MSEYENRPMNWQVKKMKEARKRYLRWYDGSTGTLPKNIIKNVLTMDRIYSNNSTLWSV